MDNLIQSSTSALLSVALDATAMRQQAMAQNIANANVPGYRALGVNFEGRLAEARAQLAEGRSVSGAAIAQLRPSFTSAASAEPIALDVEVAKMSENTLQQQVLLKALNRHYSILSTAISGDKR